MLVRMFRGGGSNWRVDPPIAGDTDWIERRKWEDKLKISIEFFLLPDYRLNVISRLILLLPCFLCHDGMCPPMLWVYINSSLSCFCLSFSIARRKELIYQVRSMLLQMLVYNEVIYLIVEFFVSSNSVGFDIGIPSSYLQIKYKLCLRHISEPTRRSWSS